MNKIKVVLGEHVFEVSRLNIGQIERTSDAFKDLNARNVPYQVLRIALERAVPPKTAEEVDGLECSLDEVAAAVDAILIFSGFRKAEEPGPNAQAPAQAPGAGS